MESYCIYFPFFFHSVLHSRDFSTLLHSYNQLTYYCIIFHFTYLFHYWWICGVLSIFLLLKQHCYEYFEHVSHCKCIGVSLGYTHLGVSMSSALLDVAKLFVKMVVMGTLSPAVDQPFSCIYSSTLYFYQLLTSLPILSVCNGISLWFNLHFPGYW